MYQGIAGGHILVLVLYLLVLALGVAAVYLVIRLAVFHALKSHTRWVDQGKP